MSCICEHTTNRGILTVALLIVLSASAIVAMGSGDGTDAAVSTYDRLEFDYITEPQQSFLDEIDDPIYGDIRINIVSAQGGYCSFAFDIRDLPQNFGGVTMYRLIDGEESDTHHFDTGDFWTYEGWYYFTPSIDAEPGYYHYVFYPTYDAAGENVVDYIEPLHFEFNVVVAGTTYTYLTSIEFDANGGIESSVPGEVEDERTSETVLTSTIDLTIPGTEPTHADTDMVFGGWATSSGGSAVYQPNSTVEMDPGAEITLYAVWDEAEIVVTFMDRGSTYRTVPISPGDLVSFPEEPSRSGYVFRGWYTDSGCNDKFQTSTRPSSNITLYAGWVEELAFDTEPSASINVTEVVGYNRTYIFDASDSEGFRDVLWDFGDGTTSDQLYATHTYEGDGSYTVTLTVYGIDDTEGSTFIDLDVGGSSEGFFEEHGVFFIVFGILAAVLAISYLVFVRHPAVILFALILAVVSAAAFVTADFGLEVI